MARQNWKQIGAYRGIIHPSADSASVSKALASISELLSSDSAVVLQAGRHRTIRLPSFGVGGETRLDVVVKAFGRQSFFKDIWDRCFGSKAFRTYRAAAFLTAAGIGTIHPVAVLERWSGPVLRESYFISRYMADTVCFKDRLGELFSRDADFGEFRRLFDIVADGVRAMHDSGCAHGDLGNQNIEIRNLDSAGAEPQCVFLDLNRASCRRSLSQCARARDLVRIWLPPACRKDFLRRYWNGHPPFLFSAAFAFWYRLFRFHSVTRSMRHPLREMKYRRHPELAPQSAAYPRGKAIEEWQRRKLSEKADS